MHVALACAAAFGMLSAQAASVFAVTEPWVRVAPDGRSAEVFMQLRSSDSAAVVGVKSEAVTGVTMRPAGTGRATVARIALPRARPCCSLPASSGSHPEARQAAQAGGSRAVRTDREDAAGGKREIAVDAEVRRHSPTADRLAPHKHRAPAADRRPRFQETPDVRCAPPRYDGPRALAESLSAVRADERRRRDVEPRRPARRLRISRPRPRRGDRRTHRRQAHPRAQAASGAHRLALARHDGALRASCCAARSRSASPASTAT